MSMSWLEMEAIVRLRAWETERACRQATLLKEALAEPPLRAGRLGRRFTPAPAPVFEPVLDDAVAEFLARTGR